MIKLQEAIKGFVLLPRRWVVERSFGWLDRFGLGRDCERLPENPCWASLFGLRHAHARSCRASTSRFLTRSNNATNF
ncbi:conserved hypothetical protein [Paraburkholderia piptadeniae]|uniref:Transposase IS4-like domain-containing protein n=1 Tax=Paraburkholderia piptadeniae TaxID=1701573 RepID=A0A1N7RWD7_9BURK|nr:conserved hypothetical protein [Paraburkholderia piptadeniae]